MNNEQDMESVVDQLEERVLDRLVYVWLDGFTSGATSALVTFEWKGEEGEPPAELKQKAESNACLLAQTVHDDRVMHEVIKRAVMSRIVGGPDFDSPTEGFVIQNPYYHGGDDA